MKLRLLLTRPNKFKNRPKYDPRAVTILSKNIDDIQDKDGNITGSTITFMCTTPSSSRNEYYTQIIEVFDEHITLNSDVKVYCSCPSFRYEFAYLLSKSKGLYGDSYEDFISGRIEHHIWNKFSRFRGFLTRMKNPKAFKPPKKNNIPYVCKHIEACFNRILSIT